MNAFMKEFTAAAKEGPRLYFEPLVAVLKVFRAVGNAWKNRRHQHAH